MMDAIHHLEGCQYSNPPGHKHSILEHDVTQLD